MSTDGSSTQRIGQGAPRSRANAYRKSLPVLFGIALAVLVKIAGFDQEVNANVPLKSRQNAALRAASPRSVSSVAQTESPIDARGTTAGMHERAAYRVQRVAGDTQRSEAPIELLPSTNVRGKRASCEDSARDHRRSTSDQGCAHIRHEDVGSFGLPV